jgi:hypothetical protein
MPRVGQMRCSVGGVSIRRGTTLLFVCGAVEDGNKFGHRKGIGKLAEFKASWAAMLAEMALTAEQRCHEAAMQEKALADDAESQRPQELAAPAAALAESVSAVERSCQESADHPAVLAETTLANKRRCQKEAERGAMLEKTVLAAEQRRSLLATRAAELALAMA